MTFMLLSEMCCCPWVANIFSKSSSCISHSGTCGDLWFLRSNMYHVIRTHDFIAAREIKHYYDKPRSHDIFHIGIVNPVYLYRINVAFIRP